MLHGPGAKDPCRGPRRDGVRWDVARDDRSGADDTIFPDRHAGQDRRAKADKAIIADLHVARGWVYGIADFHAAFYRINGVRHVYDGAISGNRNVVAYTNTTMANDVDILLNVHIIPNAKPRQRVLTVDHYFYAPAMSDDRTAADSNAVRKANHVLVKNDAALADPTIAAGKNERCIKSSYAEMSSMSQLYKPGNALRKSFGRWSISHALRPIRHLPN